MNQSTYLEFVSRHKELKVNHQQSFFAPRMKLSPFCPELVFIEGGTFLMGNLAKPVEQPVIQVSVPSFWIGKYLVTFDEYDHFCEQTGREKPALYRSERQGYPVTVWRFTKSGGQ